MILGAAHVDDNKTMRVLAEIRDKQNAKLSEPSSSSEQR